jgi:hypothetical protein
MPSGRGTMGPHASHLPGLRRLAVGCLVVGLLAIAGYAAWIGRQPEPAQPVASAALCSRALSGSGSEWDPAPVFRDAVTQVQRRALTVEQCRESLGLASVPPDTSPRSAQGPSGPEPPPIARVEYGGKEPAILRYRDIVVEVHSASVHEDSTVGAPVFTGHYRGQIIFSLSIDDAEDRYDAVEVRRLDPRTSLPQIILTAYTGGAHCCTATRIVTYAGERWSVMDAGQIDGDTGYRFRDLNGDGGSELIGVDNSFLYAYSAYAFSYAPTVIRMLSGSELVTVTRDPRYRGFLRDELHSMEADASESKILESDVGRNGYLAGWVAEKSLVGEVQDAWQAMLRSYQRDSNWSVEECLTGGPPDECLGAETYPVSFPPALASHLVHTGYLTAEQGFWLGKMRVHH